MDDTEQTLQPDLLKQRHVFEEQAQEAMKKNHPISDMLDKTDDLSTFETALRDYLNQHHESGQLEKPPQLSWTDLLSIAAHELRKETSQIEDPDSQKLAEIQQRKRRSDVDAIIIGCYAEKQVHGLPDVVDAYKNQKQQLAQPKFWNDKREKLEEFLKYLGNVNEELATLNEFRWGDRDYTPGKSKTEPPSRDSLPLVNGVHPFDAAGEVLDVFNSVRSGYELYGQLGMRRFPSETPK